MKIGYFADGPWSHKALKKLLEIKKVKIVFICGRFDKTDQSLKKIASTLNLPFLKHKNVNSKEFINDIKSYKADIFVSMSFNQIFKQEMINLPRFKIINCHAGKLPYYRGRNVLNWVLINDEKEFGITVHYIDDKIDTGNIIKQKCIPINDDDDYNSLLNKAYDGCALVLYESIKDILSGNVREKTQNKIHPLGFYCSARIPGDERMSWNKKSREIFNFVRAICPPGPSARCFCGSNEVKINKTKLVKDAPKYIGIAGTILSVEKNSLLVKTLDSFIRVTDWETNINIKVGDRLK